MFWFSYHPTARHQRHCVKTGRVALLISTRSWLNRELQYELYCECGNRKYGLTTVASLTTLLCGQWLIDHSFKNYAPVCKNVLMSWTLWAHADNFQELRAFLGHKQ